MGQHRLVPPLLPAWYVSRPGLVRRVLGVPPGGVVLVTTPPGYGATLLLAEVAGSSPAPVAWVSCPDHVAGFRRHLLAALRDAGVDVAPVQPQATAETNEFADALLTALAGAGEPVLLLLDDVDALRSPDVVTDLLALADALPATTRMVVRVEHLDRSSRRAVTAGRLVHLTDADLTLTEDEQREILRRLDPPLAAHQAEALVRLADGWAAAITAPFVPGARDPHHDPAAWLVDVGVEVLGPAVLEPLPDDDREMVVAVAVPRVVTPALAARLSGRPEAEAGHALRRLRRWGLLHPVAGSPEALRLHELVARYARGLAAARGPSALARLHRITAEALHANGEESQAIDHAIEAGDLTWALAMLEGSVGSLIDTGQATRVQEWYRRTPSDAVTGHHLHLLAATWASLLAGHLSEAQRGLDQLIDAVAELQASASETLDGGPNDEETGLTWLQPEVALLRSYLAWWRGRPEASRRLAREALVGFGGRWTRTAHQAAAVMAVRPAVWWGDPAIAQSALSQIRSRPGTHDPVRHVLVPGLQALLAVREGRVRRGAALAEQALDAARVEGSPTPFQNAEARLARAQAWLDLGDAAAAFVESAGLAEQTTQAGHVTYLVLAHVIQAQALARLGQPEQGLSLVASTRRDGVGAGAGAELVRSLDVAEARIRLENGDRRGARAIVRRLPAGPSVALLTARAAHPGSGEALRHLRTVRPSTVRQSVETGFAMAAALAAVRPEEARRYLRQAAALADEAGLLCALCGYPDELRVLAAQAAQSADGAAVAALLSHTQPRPPPPAPTPAPGVRLSDGERALVASLREHVGYRALAEDLGVSVNTVKTRVRRLYRKLGVSTREAALSSVDAGGLTAERPVGATLSPPPPRPGRSAPG